MIIGFTGKLESGKTTAANILIKNIKGDAVSIAYADLLKEMLMKAGLCTREELYDKKTKFSRMMMQKIGTEIIRKQVSENFWIDAMTKKISKIRNEYGKDINIIIHDVRFLNEAELVRWFKGTIIRVERDTENNTKSTHLSETEMDEIIPNIVIDNNGTLEDLNNSILTIIENNFFIDKKDE